jgi:hypothetical protein
MQQGVEHLTTHLCHIFRACLARGYIPVGATHMHQSLHFPQQHREGERGTHAAAASPFPATACSKVIQPTPPTGHGIGAQQVSPPSQSQNRLSRVHRINRGRLTDNQHSLTRSSRRGVTQQAADSAGGTGEVYP